jgi:hypothetical protein
VVARFIHRRHLPAITGPTLTGTSNTMTDSIASSYPGVQRVIRRQLGSAESGISHGVRGPSLQVQLQALGETPGDQVVHTFKAKIIYCLQTVQWACGVPIGWGKCYRSESTPQVLSFLNKNLGGLPCLSTQLHRIRQNMRPSPPYRHSESR